MVGRATTSGSDGAAGRPPVHWLGHPALPLAVLALLALWANGLAALVLLSPALPGLAQVVLTLCGYDPLRSAVRAGDLAILLVQSYAFAATVAWLYSDDVRRWWAARGLRAFALVAFLAPLVGFGSALALGRAVLNAPEGPPVVRAPLVLPDVELIDQHGTILRTATLRGRIVLLTFVYADCSESCPLLVRQVEAVLRRFPADEVGRDLVAVAVTLDPRRDDPAALAAAAGRWQLSDPRLYLATGAPETVRALLDTSALWRRPRPAGGWDHANLVLVLDRQGREAFADTAAAPDAERLVTAIRHLLQSGV